MRVSAMVHFGGCVGVEFGKPIGEPFVSSFVDVASDFHHQ